MVTFLSEVSGGSHRLFLQGSGTRWVLNKHWTPVPVLKVPLCLLSGPVLCSEERKRVTGESIMHPRDAGRERRCHGNHVLALFSV